MHLGAWRTLSGLCPISQHKGTAGQAAGGVLY